MVTERESCLACGSTDDIDFHHWEYENDRGCTLCRQCHEYLHAPDGGRPSETAGNQWLEVALPRLVDLHLKYHRFGASGSQMQSIYNIPEKHEIRLQQLYREKTD